MKDKVLPRRATLVVLVAAFQTAVAGAAEIPHLVRQGTATQLVVGGEPYVMLAGELHNSSASSMAYMEPMWKSWSL
jgi:hypothetical protein